MTNLKRTQKDKFKSPQNQMTHLANDPKWQMVDLNQPNGRYLKTDLNPQNVRFKKDPKWQCYYHTK